MKLKQQKQHFEQHYMPLKEHEISLQKSIGQAQNLFMLQAQPIMTTQ